MTVGWGADFCIGLGGGGSVKDGGQVLEDFDARECGPAGLAKAKDQEGQTTRVV